MIEWRKSVLQYNQYYFCDLETHISMEDYEVSELINMNRDEFRNLMTSSFNAFIQRESNQLRFINQKDIEAAIDYINSIQLMKKIEKTS